MGQEHHPSWGQVRKGAGEFPELENISLQAHHLGPGALGGVWRGKPALCGRPVARVPGGKVKAWRSSVGAGGNPETVSQRRNPGSRGEVNAPVRLTADASSRRLTLVTAFATLPQARTPRDLPLYSDIVQFSSLLKRHRFST